MTDVQPFVLVEDKIHAKLGITFAAVPENQGIHVMPPNPVGVVYPVNPVFTSVTTFQEEMGNHALQATAVVEDYNVRQEVINAENLRKLERAAI